MNSVMYQLTGVKRPITDPTALRDLSSLWETVRSAAASCQYQTKSAIDHVMTNNVDAATDAFHEAVTGEQSAHSQLERLAAAALLTRDAHAAAASHIESGQKQMDDVASKAWWMWVKSLVLPPPLGPTYRAQLVNQTRTALLAISAVTQTSVNSAYASVGLPPQLSASTEQARGSVPQQVADEWAKLTPEQQMQVLNKIADDFTDGWPDRPKIIYYSNQKPQPPGTVPTPDGWDGYNGVSSGDEVWMNYDQLGANPTLMSTMVHEHQHYKQNKMREEYDSLVKSDPSAIADIRAGRRPDPFVSQGSTLDEVERMRTPYQSADTPYYYHQTVEVDARRAGTEYLDNLTYERYQKIVQ